MKRYAINELLKWKEKKTRKPLLIQGARQVGKTWLMKEFGKTHYKQVAYLSFNDNDKARDVFTGAYNIQHIISSLELLTDTKILPNETLIILDEIQECDRALNALKFFKENAPEYHIIAAGSLLGVALKHKNISFPVGQVEFLELHPLSFLEFLQALDEDKLVDLLTAEKLNFKLIDLVHDKLIALLKQYFIIGGMPEAVSTYLESKDYNQVRKVQKQILTGYQNDFSKYIGASYIPRINAVWNSIPHQLAKENKKFAYNKVAKGARAREYEEAIEWLILCGLVHRVHKISKPNLPLSSYAESSAFKLYLLDCGLLSTRALLEPEVIIEGNDIFTEFKGSLTEQYVLQELKNIEDLPLAYWATDTGSAELDFVFQHKGQIIPLEVKATINLKARSLASYREKYSQKLAVRTSLANYKEENQLFDIPLYLIGRVTEVQENTLN